MAIKSDPAESVADLKRLYNVEATVEHTGRHGLVRTLRAFFENWDSFIDYTVLITKFPPQTFDTEEDNIPTIPWKGKNSYFRNSKILISTMAGRPHNILSRAHRPTSIERFHRIVGVGLEGSRQINFQIWPLGSRDKFDR